MVYSFLVKVIFSLIGSKKNGNFDRIAVLFFLPENPLISGTSGLRPLRKQPPRSSFHSGVLLLYKLTVLHLLAKSFSQRGIVQYGGGFRAGYGALPYPGEQRGARRDPRAHR